MARTGRPARRRLLVGGVFYLAYLVLVASRGRQSASVGAQACARTPEAADILGRPRRQEPDRDADREAADAPAPTGRTTRPTPASLDDLICYFEGEFVPMRDAKVSIMTHAFMYGTATFEGIRAYWNEDAGQLYGLKIREHVERIRQSCRILLMEDVPSVDELTGLIVETVRRNGFREDAYIRPSFYKSTRAIGVRLHDLDHELYILALPFGNYIDTEHGIRVMTSSWRRNADEALPARGKIVGGYVNMAFQKSEAELNGFDEALVLTADGHVNEASAANLFIVRDGVALTPPVTDDILEGVTRKAIIEMLRRRGHPASRSARSTAPSCTSPTRCSCAAPASRSRRSSRSTTGPVGAGEIGPIGRLVRDRYFDAVRGRLPEYATG